MSRCVTYLRGVCILFIIIMARVQYIYTIYTYIIYNIQSTERKLLSLAFGNHSEDTFFSLSTFRRRRRRLLAFARINSRATSINHSSHTRTHKKRLARRCKGRWKNMGLSWRVFLPPVPRAPRATHLCRRFVYFIINTNIANTSSVRLSDLHHLYRCQNKK